MQAKSDVLFIIICSNNKVPHGPSYAAYARDDRVAGHIDPASARRLIRNRCEILRLIRENPEAHLGGVPIRDLPLSRGLTMGPDFDREAGTAGGQYLPAIQRYAGGFYLGLGRDRLAQVGKTKHHILIVSGLYGLVTPLELVQSYSCHVGHHKRIPAVWQSNDLLASLIAGYIARHKITTVLDLMADDDYRKLVAWEVVRDATRGKVLHAFSDMYAGKAALPSFGALLAQLLETPARALRNLEAHDAIAVRELGTSVTLVDYLDPTPSPATIRVAAPDLARLESRPAPKQDVRVTHADIIGRMRRNYLKVMAYILALGPRDNVDFLPRARAVIAGEPDCQKQQELSRILGDFARIRNNVEYRRRELSSAEIRELRADYRNAMSWLLPRVSNCCDLRGLEAID